MIHLSEGFEETVMVPCCAREWFNSLMDDLILIKPSNGVEYKIDVKKEPQKTVLRGEWSFFCNDYALALGDGVLLKHKGDNLMFEVIPFDVEGAERVPKDKAAAHIANAEPARDIVNAGMASTNISTNTLYYLHPYSRANDANGDENGQRTEQGLYQPRRDVGTREMIQEAFAARAAEKEVLEERIRKLKEEMAMLNAGASMKK